MVISLPSILQADPKVPIVYHPGYNISLMPGQGLMHPFDSQKYGKVFKKVTDTFGIHPQECHQPTIASDETLKTIHTEAYLNSLKESKTIGKITEIGPLKHVPNFWLQRKILKSMKFATQGTIDATELALKHKWSINLAGGYHHAKADKGEGFCVYADIPIAINSLFKNHPDKVKKVLVVDLDAHQGNGFETILENDNRVTTFDIYNQDRYPTHDRHLKITYNNPVKEGCNDQHYLSILKTRLPQAIAQTKPDFIIYNAGTDILKGDRVGGMGVSEEGIIQRDEFVFEQAQASGIPITMVLSGGYTDRSAKVIGDSIINLKEKFFKDEIETVAKQSPKQSLLYRHPGKVTLAATGLCLLAGWAGYNYYNSNKDAAGKKLVDTHGKPVSRSVAQAWENMQSQAQKAKMWMKSNKIKTTLLTTAAVVALVEFGYRFAGRIDSPINSFLCNY